MDIRDIYKKVVELEECGDGMPPMGSPMQTPGSPVSMNVSLNASGMENVKDLMDLVKNAGLQPTSKMALSMEPKGGEMMGPKPCPICGGMHEEEMACEDWDNSPDEEYKDDDFMTKDISGGINRKKKHYPASVQGDNPMAVKEQLMADWQTLKHRNK